MPLNNLKLLMYKKFHPALKLIIYVNDNDYYSFSEHPNLKLIIMHGGMATTIETINAGVPTVGIPMYADQPGNINSLVNKGAAIAVDYYDISEETLYNAIIEVLSNER